MERVKGRKVELWAKDYFWIGGAWEGKCRKEKLCPSSLFSIKEII